LSYKFRQLTSVVFFVYAKSRPDRFNEFSIVQQTTIVNETYFFSPFPKICFYNLRPLSTGVVSSIGVFPGGIQPNWSRNL
jgi:hypothetical protein